MDLEFLEIFPEQYEEYREQILDLRKNVFPYEDLQKMEPVFWNWEFRDNIHQFSQIFLAKDLNTNQVIGHYALIPYQLIINGDSKLLGLAVDAMVHTRYRKKGVGSKLQKLAVDNSRFDGIIGYTLRDEIKSIEKKGGYQCIRKIPVYIYPINFKKILIDYERGKYLFLAPIVKFLFRSFYRISNLQNSSMVVVNQIPNPTLNQFSIWLSNRFNAYGLRESKILSWRFSNEAGICYRILRYSGKSDVYFITTRTEIHGLDSLNLLDIIFAEYDSDDISAGINALKCYAIQEKCDCISFFCADDDIISKITQKVGFIKSPFRFQFIVHSNNNELTKQLVRSNLYLTYYDTDFL
ncbi:MAG TPA: GNAT family N-acetyltransferase [Candidatus Cloacimonadota bacterium]|nr:GNAT family N-acetyltransferase [Candidatus Cloacimonadota bacterium]